MACSCTPYLDNRPMAQGPMRKSKTKPRGRSNSCDTRLHSAAKTNNEKTARSLIASGCTVDCWGQDGETPLMIAVQNDCKDTTRVLLEAGANINIINAKGESALFMALHRDIDYKVVEAIILRAKAEAPTTEALVQKLLDAQCCFPYAVLARDANVLIDLLVLGYDINSRNLDDKAAMHFAALVNEVKLVKLLLDKGADVNASDIFGNCPIYFAAIRRNPAMIKLLLDNGANANPQKCQCVEYFPLFVGLVVGRSDENERVRECVQLLLQHGAYPRNPPEFLSELSSYPNVHENSRIKYIIPHVVMLDMLDIESCDERRLFEKLPEIENYYVQCRQVLEMTVGGTVSLLNLLTFNEREMKVHLRREMFVLQVEQFSTPEFKELYPYYANLMMKRIVETTRAIELEDRAILVVCDIFGCNQDSCNYNKLYIFAKRVVSYLSKSDHENLCQV